jgi:DNA-binding protein
MIVKRMNAMGYKVSDVRIFSERMESKDGKERNVSTIEVDVSRTQDG